MSPQMDETFAIALRELLVQQVQNPGTDRSWLSRPRRRVSGIAAALILLAAGGGIAYATGVFTTPPGGPVITHLQAPVTVTGSGNKTILLGAQPTGTNAIDYSFTCLTAGDFTLADGPRLVCGSADASTKSATATGTLPTEAGQNSTTVTASPGERWQLTATYSRVVTSQWGVNASGQTYGVANQHGTPDLIAVQASNGHEGYVYADQLTSPAPKTPTQAAAENNAPPRTLTVYEADGETAIGVFRTGTGPIPSQTTTTVAP